MASAQPNATASWRRWRFRGIVLLLVLPVVAAYALVMTGNARADGSGPSPDPSADALGAAGGQAVSDAQATTDQAANAAADAAQEARNVVISIRVDSPGDDGDISQANTAAAGAGATNDASTAQGQGQGGDPGNGGDVASSLEAAAQQAANAVAAAAQQAQNVVISIRINSPGNNGSIGQSNTATANGDAGNTAATNQGPGAASPQADPATTVDSSTTPGGSAPAPPANSPAASVTPGASGPRSVLPRLITTRPSHEEPARAPASRPATHRADITAASQAPERDSESPRLSASSSGEQASSGVPTNVANAAAEAHQKGSMPAKPSPQTTTPSASTRPRHGLTGIGNRAASFLRGLDYTPKAQDASAEDISNSVFLALIALMVAVSLLLLFRYPDRLRRLHLRTWRHR